MNLPILLLYYRNHITVLKKKEAYDWVDTSARGYSQAWMTKKIKTF
jgi:hypothetical protein